MEIRELGNIRGRKGDKGLKGDKGNPGLNSVPTDDAFAAIIADAETTSGALIRAMYGAGKPSDIGAVGDGIADDTLALQNVFRFGGKIPAGIYKVSAELTAYDNAVVVGAGIDATTIRFADGTPRTSNVITNVGNTHSAHTTPNRQIHISDLTVDHNYPNLADTTVHPGVGTYGCAVMLACVEDSSLTRVRAIRGYLHCIDVSASVYNDATIAHAPGPSRRVSLVGCIAEDPFWDDGITTHHSDGVTIDWCSSTNDLPSIFYNQNGIEIDEGSRNVTVTNCYVRGWAKGYQAKGHDTSYPAYNVSFENCLAENCNYGMDIAWTQTPVYADAKAAGVRINNFRAVRLTTRYSGTTPVAFTDLLALSIQGYTNVIVDGITVEDTQGGGISIFGAASNVQLNGSTFRNALRASLSDSDCGIQLSPSVFDITVRNTTFATAPVTHGISIQGEGAATIAGVSGIGVAGKSAVKIAGRGFNKSVTGVTTNGFGTKVATDYGNYTEFGGLVSAANTLKNAAGVTGTISYAVSGGLVTVYMVNVQVSTSGNQTITTAGMPPGLRPAQAVYLGSRKDGAANGGELPYMSSSTGNFSGYYAAGVQYSGSATYVASL